jgi:hypothetical protein
VTNNGESRIEPFFPPLIAHSWLPCEACGTTIHKTRVLCLDCESDDTVDFCRNIACIDIDKLPHRKDVRHQASHLLVKTRDHLLVQDFYSLKSKVQTRLTHAINDFRPLMDTISEFTVSVVDEGVADIAGLPSPAFTDDKEQTKGQAMELPFCFNLIVSTTAATSRVAPLRQDSVESTTEILPSLCTICRNVLTLPAWYCVDCPQGKFQPVLCTIADSLADDAFVCDACDGVIDDMMPWDFQERYRIERSQSQLCHNVYHKLVRFRGQPQTSDDPNPVKDVSLPSEVEERLMKRIEAVISDRFSELDDRLTRVENRVELGLQNIERLLQNLIMGQGLHSRTIDRRSLQLIRP